MTSNVKKFTRSSLLLSDLSLEILTSNNSTSAILA